MAKYDISIRDYWRIIRKRRTVVILSTILFTVFSYLFAVVHTPEPHYEAISAVKLEKATDLTTLLPGTVYWTSWDNLATQAVIITSFPVIEESAQQMGLIPENICSVQFKTDEMDYNEWLSYKRDFFKLSAKRNVQISDMQIQNNGSGAVVTFKQSYQTANHRDLGIKTLYLRYDDDRWTILKESWQPFSGQG